MAALRGGLQGIRFSPGRVDALWLPPGGPAGTMLRDHAFLAYTGSPHSSDVNWRMIRGAIDGDGMVLRKFRGIATTARDAWDAVSAADPRGTGAAIAAEWTIRKTLAPGVSTAGVEELLHDRRFRRLVIGAKLCGAGGGGMLFGLLRDPDDREAVEVLLSGTGCPSSRSGSPAARGSRRSEWRLKKRGTSPLSARVPRDVRRPDAGRDALGPRSRREGPHRRGGRDDRRKAQPLSPHRPRPRRTSDDRAGADARIAAVDDVSSPTAPTARSTARTASGSTRGSIGYLVRRETPKGEWDITLRPARQRHMGTDLAHRVVARMTESITSAGAASPSIRGRRDLPGARRPLRPAHSEGGTAREVRRGRTRTRRRLLVPGGGPGARGHHALRLPSTSAAGWRWHRRSTRRSPAYCTIRSSSS